MPPSRRTSRPRPWVASLIATAVLLGTGGCGGGGGIGERCDSVSECADGLQCLNHICLPRCERHADCGDGHVCRTDGTCEVVDSMVGDFCDREIDCGPGQACKLRDEDLDGDGFLAGECQPEESGGVLDDACTGDTPEEADAQCRTGTCALGRCVHVCVEDLDCPVSHVCSTIPRLIPPPSRVSSFWGCLPSTGTITYSVPTDEPYEQRILLPVPGAARSVALVASIDDLDQLVGAVSLESPEGDSLYLVPFTRDEYFANTVRHELLPGISTLTMPQTPDAPFAKGAYFVDVGSYLDLETPGTEVPDIDIIYKLDDSRHLDIRFHFLDLESHPCQDRLDGAIDALGAQESNAFQDVFLRELDLIFARAGVILERDAATYIDIPDRPDLDGLDVSRLGDLLALSEQTGGVNVFFVRTIAPAGLQGLAGGPPAPPGVPGTRASGVAIAMDTLCYEDWRYLARTTAHELARTLGLSRSVEPDGHEDPIADSDYGVNNLMYFSDHGDSDLSAGQRQILRLSPALR